MAHVGIVESWWRYEMPALSWDGMDYVGSDGSITVRLSHIDDGWYVMRVRLVAWMREEAEHMESEGVYTGVRYGRMLASVKLRANVDGAARSLWGALEPDVRAIVDSAAKREGDRGE